MTYTNRFLISLTFTLVLVGVNTARANPDIKDETIGVLLNFKTNCNLQSISREVTEDNGLKFTATCGDITFYPEGLIVLCPIRDVETSCKIMTQPNEFKNLNLIYGPAGKNEHYSDQEDKEE